MTKPWVKLFNAKGFLVKEIQLDYIVPDSPRVVILGRRFFIWQSPNQYVECKGVFI